jgi:hypothetical protein
MNYMFHRVMRSAGFAVSSGKLTFLRRAGSQQQAAAVLGTARLAPAIGFQSNGASLFGRLTF